MTDRLTVAQAAQALGVTPSLVRRLIRQGRIRAEKTETQRGAEYWIDPADCHYTYRPNGRPKKETER